MKQNVFDDFAPRILKLYHENQDEFWDAVMTPFLADSNLTTLFKYRKIGLELMSLFSEIDRERIRFLSEYSTSFEFNLSKWKSLLKKEEYFKDAYPVYAFLVIWMDHMKMNDHLSRFGNLLRSVVYGIAGYGILDVIVDDKQFSPVELLTSLMLVAEYETLILKTFGVNQTNLDILHHIRDQFLRSEIKEKFTRGNSSPYKKGFPIECGFKAAHLLTPFMLSLEHLGKSANIDPYFEVFFLFGAVIQILDDLKDIEDDLSIGHFSYITLGSDVIEWHKKGMKPKDMVKMLWEDKQRIHQLFGECKDMIRKSRMILKQLEDPYLEKIVYVTELRLESYFRKEFKLAL